VRPRCGLMMQPLFKRTVRLALLVQLAYSWQDVFVTHLSLCFLLLQSNKLTIDCAGKLPVQLTYLGKERACPQAPTSFALATVTGSNGEPPTSPCRHAVQPNSPVGHTSLQQCTLC
jgi:hypothetical protein